jgi:D-alanyl-D-alanine carboxypeptidase
VQTPGTAFDYNNADYVVLGKIIERVSGASYERVLDDKILAPLQMADTGMLYQADIRDGLADTYFYQPETKTLVNDLPVYPENWYAAGGMFSTVHDLLKFANALFDGRLIRPDTLALMTSPGLDDYGYGVWSYKTKIGGRETRVIKRPGQIMGAQAQVYRLVDEDVTVIILSNTGTTDLDEFVAQIGKRTVARGPAEEPQPP